MDRRFLGILGGIVVIFIIIFAVTQNSNGKSNNSGSGSSGASVTKHLQGQNSAGVTLQEWGDYECPICGAYYQPLKDAVTPLLPQIHFQFSNLPLTQIHQNAFAAARAAEAAGLQNKYFEMHDKLYENQNSWVNLSDPLSQFSTYAQQLGMNVDQFKSDYASGKVNSAINADLAAFQKTGRQEATPTFYLNGQYLDNSKLSDPQTGQPSAAKITQILQAEIDRKSGSSNK